MALTAQTIKANQVLAGLSDEQVNALVQLSTNDEATVIGARIGELHGRYDQDVLAITGIAKNQSEKSYDYVKRVLGEYKTKVEGFATVQTQIDALKQEKKDLETKLANNAGDATIKQQLKDAQDKLVQLQTKYDTDKAEFDKNKSEFESKLHTLKVEHVLDAELGTLKFKSTIPESVKNVLVNTAKSELFNNYKPEFTEDNKLIFRDKDGKIVNNPENKLNPFTAGELLIKSTSLKDIIDTGRQQPGGGTKEPGKPGNPTTLDLSSAKTQVEADDLIVDHLLKSGFVRTDASFAEEQAKLRTEHSVSTLPIR